MKGRRKSAWEFQENNSLLGTHHADSHLHHIGQNGDPRPESLGREAGRARDALGRI